MWGIEATQWNLIWANMLGGLLSTAALLVFAALVIPTLRAVLRRIRRHRARSTVAFGVTCASCGTCGFCVQGCRHDA